MSKGSCLNRKQIIKEGILEYHKGENTESKNMDNIMCFTSRLKLLNCLKVKEKLQHWCNSKCIQIFKIGQLYNINEKG